MRFKVDENLPVEIAELLRSEGHDALTVVDQAMKGRSDPDIARVCQDEDRIVVTLDLDFADIQTYPPQDYPGLVVLRLRRQDRLYVINAFRRLLPILLTEVITNRLWIVEEGRIRIRGESS